MMRRGRGVVLNKKVLKSLMESYLGEIKGEKLLFFFLRNLEYISNLSKLILFDIQQEYALSEY
jgi:hypothetical protein